jgi:hypothetical protein
MMVEGAIPKNYYDELYLYSTINFAGDSFLLHPDVLLFNAFRYSTRDISIYLSIASLRPLAEYLATGTVTLPQILCPVDPLEHLDDKTSGLISIDGEDIHFLYESTPDEKHLN